MSTFIFSSVHLFIIFFFIFNLDLIFSSVTSEEFFTLITSALERVAANSPCGESSIIRVSSGKQPIIDIAFQYISGCGLAFLTSSLVIITSKYSITPTLAKATKAVLRIQLVQQPII